jgi:hypothetical protein
MTDEKWQVLIETAKKNFKNVTLRTEDLLGESAEGEVKQGTQDILEFENAQGSFRIVRENKPVVLEKKMHFSHRQGDSARTEYVFSETEFSHKIVVFMEDIQGEWQRIEGSSFGI